MDGGSADHAGAVICRPAGECDGHWRNRPRGGLLQRFYQDLYRGYPGAVAPRLLHRLTMDLKPPQNMRMPSNGMVSGPMSAIRGSFIALALTRSRCARDL